MGSAELNVNIEDSIFMSEKVLVAMSRTPCPLQGFGAEAEGYDIETPQFSD